MPVALTTAAVLLATLATPAQADGTTRALAPGVTVQTTFSGQGTGHNFWTVTALVPYGWGVKRNPRTMVGLDRQGRLLIVTADGRQPGFSEGLFLLEGANLMAKLGAVNAINLDGGGSTATAIDGKLVGSPSDATGERPVGDALLVVQ